jgi:hypothetical protein
VLWTAPDLATLIGSLIAAGPGGEGYLEEDAEGRLRARERFCFEMTTLTQAGLIRAAISAGEWAEESASAEEIERLTRPKESPGHSTRAWKGSVLLILVKPVQRYWRVPAGRVLAISPATDSSVLYGSLRMSWLTGAGHLEIPRKGR